MTTPKLSLNELSAYQSQPHITVNAALRKLDVLVHLAVEDRAANDPPGSPSEGDAYIIGASPTAEWSSFAEDNLVVFVGLAWQALVPREGWLVWVKDEGTHYLFNSIGTWTELATGGGSGGGGTGAGVLTILDRALNTPPGSPADGDAYIVGAAPTGAWSAFAQNSIATYVALTTSWAETPPAELEGTIVWVTDENLFYDFYVTWRLHAPDMLVSTDWEHKGDLLVGTADNTAAILRSDTAGNGQALIRDDAQTTGMKWAELASYTCENLGGGVGLFKTDTAGIGAAVIHQFYTLAEGTNISFDLVGNLLTINGDAGSVSLGDGDYGDIVISGSGTVFTVDASSITKAKMANALALSVIGRSANSTGVVADIVAGTDGHVLRRNGTSIGFGQLILAAYADNSVDTTKMSDFSAANRLLGRGSAGAGGDPQEISLGAGLTMSGTTLSTSAGATNQYNGAATGQSGFTTDTYLTGSDVLIDDGTVTPWTGSFYRAKIAVARSGAGTAAPVLKIRIGTNAAIADTAVLTLTFGAQTGVADTGVIEVLINFISVGSGTSAQISATASFIHNLSTTGLQTLSAAVVTGTSSTFDSTITDTVIGISLNSGTSSTWTIKNVQAEVLNLTT